MISGTLPMWTLTLPKVCPFLFSRVAYGLRGAFRRQGLKTRKMLMKLTAFGPSFAVHWTQAQQAR